MFMLYLGFIWSKHIAFHIRRDSIIAELGLAHDEYRGQKKAIQFVYDYR